MERPTGTELRIRRQANITSELRCRFDFANLGKPGRFELPGKKSREVRKEMKGGNEATNGSGITHSPSGEHNVGNKMPL